MARSGKVYGYTIALTEVRETIPELFDAVVQFRRMYMDNISRSALWEALLTTTWLPLPIRLFLQNRSSRNEQGDTWNLCHFWNNFEIVDMDFLRGDKYRRFFEYMDRKGGIYYQRVSICNQSHVFLTNTSPVGRCAHPHLCCRIIPQAGPDPSFWRYWLHS